MITVENHLSYETYFALRESVGWNNFLPEQAKRALDNSYYSIVVKEADEAIAMGRIVGDGIYFTIVDVAVHPKHQGQGIGKMIMQNLLSYLEEQLPEGAKASVSLIAEAGKEEFYRKQGFQTIPCEGCGPALRKIIWKK